MQQTNNNSNNNALNLSEYVRIDEFKRLESLVGSLREQLLAQNSKVGVLEREVENLKAENLRNKEIRERRDVGVVKEIVGEPKSDSVENKGVVIESEISSENNNVLA